VPEKIEVNPDHMQYPEIYHWATKGKHRSNEMLFVNQNTNNIIHFTEILLNLE
jgi:hypothetical protein